jgi:hypothetical protein
MKVLIIIYFIFDTDKNRALQDDRQLRIQGAGL